MNATQDHGEVQAVGSLECLVDRPGDVHLD
jgi:hypothetical protein